MSFWNTFCSWFSWSDATDLEQSSFCPTEDAGCAINPATGLPMVGGCGGVDVAGNPYGVDLSSAHDLPSSSAEFESGWSGISESHSPFWPYED